MNTTTMREFRANLKAYFDSVEDNQDILLIPRSGKKEAMVIMTLSEYNSMKETEYLLSTEANRRSLEKSMKELEEGKTVKFKLED